MKRKALLFTLCIAVFGVLVLQSVSGGESSGDSTASDSAAGSGLPEGPDFKDVLSLEGVGQARISPDGEAIVYTVTSTDWQANRYDREIYLARRGQEPFQLTRTRDESSTGPSWSPDSRWVAFQADRGEGSQIYLIRAVGGEAVQLTAATDGVEDYTWSPDGRYLAVRVQEPQKKEREKREDLFGRFAVEDAEYRMSHLWLLDVEEALASGKGVGLAADQDEDEAKDAEAADEELSDEELSDGDSESEDDASMRRLTGGDTFTVDDYTFSPDSRQIAFSHRPDPLITSGHLSDLSLVEVERGEIHRLVERPGSDDSPIYSPDGKWILFSTSNGQDAYYVNGELAKVARPSSSADSDKLGEIVLLTADFDENPRAVDWLEDGIRFIAFQKTYRQLFHLDPETGRVRQLTDRPRVVSSVDYAADGKSLVLSGFDESTLPEIYRGGEAALGQLERVTVMTDQVSDWPRSTSEVINWKSRDGANIEGVLVKPVNYDPARRYPLLVIIHGGPAGISLPQRVSGYVYPVAQWLARGAVVLMPNYRGSTGYGEDFRALNVRNLGVGDAWDVLSGVDYLVDQGIADEKRLGAMGWSQGGYISAFLTTTSDRFKAISVGAGISSWMTYYVNTDVHPFTRHYLEATPWDDPEIYDKTSPMHYILDAKTPTLIQHGEFDRRVPIANAYELFQGLRDMDVASRLVVYKGFGHGIGKPKERLAAVWHNWQWFARYIWGEEVELPTE